MIDQGLTWGRVRSSQIHDLHRASRVRQGAVPLCAAPRARSFHKGEHAWPLPCHLPTLSQIQSLNAPFTAAAFTPLGPAVMPSSSRSAHRSRRRRGSAAGALACLAVAACVAPTDIESIDEIAGVWIASNAIYSEIADPTNRLDLIALGFGVTMNIEPSGDWALLLTVGTNIVDLQVGTMAVDGKLLVIVDETGTDTGRAYLEGEQVALQMRGGTEFDFDGDGTAEPAKLNLIMDRRP